MKRILPFPEHSQLESKRCGLAPRQDDCREKARALLQEASVLLASGDEEEVALGWLVGDIAEHLSEDPAHAAVGF